MMNSLKSISDTVQRNCHIADARHAADDTICIYLLKMREFFRWEQGYGYADNLPGESLAGWLTEREALWESLESEEFSPLLLGEEEIDPFEAEQANSRLLDQGYIYSAGLGHRARPHFFLAKMESREELDGYQILLSGQEFARDLSAPPAMTRENTIYLRKESLRRLLWQKLEEWRWHKPENAMGRAISSYAVDDSLDKSLDEMTEHELQSVRLHEIGEILARRQLGDQWLQLLASLPRSRAEIMARAVKDLYADCLSTLPALLQEQNTASIHFYMANLSGMRRELFPMLHKAYENWLGKPDAAILLKPVEQGLHHWRDVAGEMLQLFNTRPACEFNQALENLIEQRRL